MERCLGNVVNCSAKQSSVMQSADDERGLCSPLFSQPQLNYTR
jgi:hypothetical protein